MPSTTQMTQTAKTAQTGLNDRALDPGTRSPGDPVAIEARVARLERTNRLLSIALVGLVGVGAGAAMMAARQGAPSDAPVAPPSESRCKPVSIVLDPSRGSGRWNSTLLAVDADGLVYSLDTSRPQAVWRRFQFSP